MPKQPNIIFILIDDMGWRDLGCYGSGFYETPNIDRLAAEGMTFSDAYAACPVCSPTRASILTGRYPARVGVTDWIDHGGKLHPCKGRLIDAPYIKHLPLDETCVAGPLRDGGYQTWHVGKWHLGEEAYHPTEHGFDVNVAGCYWGSPRKGYFSPWGMPTLTDGPPGQYLTDRLTDEAIGLIRRRRADRPFFLNLWHYVVHVPIQAPAELVEKYKLKAAAMGLDAKDPFEIGENFPTEHKKDKQVTRRLFQSDPKYAAMVENLDWNVGRLLACLDELGIADDTAVFFTSDNGGLATAEGSPTCNAPLAEGKGWMYEGGTREPLIVRWPTVVEPASRCSTPITSPDFFPTFLDMGGLRPMPDKHCDGMTLMPLLKGGRLPERAIFWHYPHYGNQGGTPGCSVRQGDWKLIEFFEDDHAELYNLREDVSEDHDLAARHPTRVREMQAALHEWLDEVEAIFPLANPACGGPA